MGGSGADVADGFRACQPGHHARDEESPGSRNSVLTAAWVLIAGPYTWRDALLAASTGTVCLPVLSRSVDGDVRGGDVPEGRRGQRGGRTLPQGLDRRVAACSLGGLLTLVTSAGASPFVRHRWASVGHLTARSLALAKHGSKAVATSTLGPLLAGACRDDPRLGFLEDFLPNDPRSIVLARRGDRLVRLFPGSVERPVADVERADMVAAAVDDFLIPRLGFGVRDYVDTGLFYLDHAIGCLCPAWPDDDDLAGLAPRLASRKPSTPPPQPSPCSLCHRASLGSAARAAALRFATSPADTLPYEPDHPRASSAATSLSHCLRQPGRNCRRQNLAAGAFGGFLLPSSRTPLVTALRSWPGRRQAMPTARTVLLNWPPDARAGRCGGSAISSARTTGSPALLSRLAMLSSG